MNKALFYKLLVCAVFLSLSKLSYAGILKYENVTLDEVLIDSNDFGYCMAQIVEAAPCNRHGWVTFDCQGNFNNQTLAYRMFDQAQMALALKAKIEIRVESSEKINGYCVVKRVKVASPPSE